MNIGPNSHKIRYGANRWLILLCVSLSICACSMEMTGIAPILETIAENLNVQLGVAANLMMAYVLSIALFFTLGGIVCDRYGLTAALISGLLCCCVPAGILPLISAETFNTVFILRFIQGASVAFVLATVTHVLAVWFPVKEHGIAGGVMSGAMPIGASIGVVAAPYLLEAVGSWQGTIAILSVPGWLSIVLAALITRHSPQPIGSNPSSRRTPTAQTEMPFMTALSLPFTWIGVCIMFCNAWCHFCLYNIVPSFLATKSPVGAGLGPTLAGKLSLAVTLSGFFAMIVGGLFFDKVAKGKYQLAMLIGFSLTTIANYLILIPEIQTSILLLALCLLLAGCGMPFMSASISSCIVANYPARIAGRMMGVWFGLGTFGGALGIYFGGLSIAESGNFHWAILQTSIVASIGIAFSWIFAFRNTIKEKSEYATPV